MQSVQPKPRRDADETERRLVEHFLYADGPFGAGPLTYLDASREELAEALDVDAEEALPRLLKACGSDSDIAHVLSSGWQYGPIDPEVPGFFRFLVLTCAVVANADENPETQEFSANLKRLYGTSRSFTSRAALPGLWQRLAVWVESARRRKAPLRALVLPEPDRNEPHIGMTKAVTFPGWQDVRHLRVFFQNHYGAATAIRSPQDAARVLSHRVTVLNGFRPQMVAAAEDYERLYYARASLLGLHRFWRIVARALDVPAPRLVDAGRLHAELALGAGLLQPQIAVTLRSRNGSDPGTLQARLRTDIDSALADLRSWGDAKVSRTTQPLVDAFARGLVPFVAERFGVYVFALRRPDPADQVVLLVSRALLQRLAHHKYQTRKASEHWFIVGPLDGAKAAELLEQLGPVNTTANHLQ